MDTRRAGSGPATSHRATSRRIVSRAVAGLPGATRRLLVTGIVVAASGLATATDGRAQAADGFTLYEGRVVTAHDRETMGGSVGECAEACRQRPWCRSFEKFGTRVRSTCRLSDKAPGDPGAGITEDRSYALYVRNDAVAAATGAAMAEGVTRHEMHAITGRDRESLLEGTVAACAEVCRERSWCRSFDFNRTRASCYFNDRAPGDPDATVRDDRNVDLYVRDDAGAPGEEARVAEAGGRTQVDRDRRAADTGGGEPRPPRAPEPLAPETVAERADSVGTDRDAETVAPEEEVAEAAALEEEDRASGDCNGDGVLNAFDADCALEMSVRLRPESPEMDMDGSGTVTSRDARILLQR